VRWPFGSLVPGAYQVIYADPAWRFKTRSEKGRGRSPEQHYRTIDLPKMKQLPVWALAAPNCALVMWVYDPMLPEALELINAWGFKFKTRLFDWVKETSSGEDAFGLGYWTRKGGEQCWLATRGSPRRRAKDVRQYCRAELREHSRKPEEIARRVERLLPGPYCELFSRTSREGWDSWGDQTGKFERAA